MCNSPQITQQVGRCGPVARAVVSAEAVLCLNMVEPLVRGADFFLIDKLFLSLFSYFSLMFPSSKILCFRMRSGSVWAGA